MSLRRAAAVAVAVGAVALAFPPATPAATPPPGFDDAFYAAVPFTTGMTFVPDGRLLVTGQHGPLSVVDPRTHAVHQALDLSSRICTDHERGLEGVAVDPSFASNHFIYLYYTNTNSRGQCPVDSNDDPPVNRVVRYELAPDDTVNPATAHVLVDKMASPVGIHNAGDLEFGPDGYLYVSVGDGGCHPGNVSACAGRNTSARELNLLNGKILRVTSLGGIPPSNPFRGPGTASCAAGSAPTGVKCQEIYAYGLRNPFRFALDPNAISSAPRFFIADVGLNKWEEIDAGASGADYGWPVREGPCVYDSISDCGPPPAGMTNPIYAYDHLTLFDGKTCTAVTGGAFVPARLWPASYEGAYLYSDAVCGHVFVLRPNGPGGAWQSSTFMPDTHSVVDMEFGPDSPSQALYYLDRGTKTVRKVSYGGGSNRRPTAVAEANRTAGGSLPLTVHFDGSHSTDPDAGDALSYDWDFGDGSAHSSAASPTHAYTSAGRFRATLTVTDPHGASDTIALEIDAGNDAPVASIRSPAPDDRFSVGENLTLRGAATDAQDGALDGTRLTWSADLYHNCADPDPGIPPLSSPCHAHPFLQPTHGSTAALPSTPEPETLAAAAHSYLVLHLTATDSQGLSSTVDQALLPRRVPVTIATEPAGLAAQVNELTVTGPQTVVSWAAFALELHAEAQHVGEETWTPRCWSDGGPAVHTVTTPAAPATYTVTFSRTADLPAACQAPAPPSAPLVSPILPGIPSAGFMPQPPSQSGRDGAKAAYLLARQRSGLARGLAGLAHLDLARMIRRGWAEQLDWPAAGSEHVTWVARQSARRARGAAASPLTVARGARYRPVAGRASLRVHLTAAGRRLLRRHARVALTVKATFSPADSGAKITARKRVTLRVHATR